VPIVSRVAVSDDVIDGQHVPAGTLIFCNIKVRVITWFIAGARASLVMGTQWNAFYVD
jgi:hypothetical protein